MVSRVAPGPRDQQDRKARPERKVHRAPWALPCDDVFIGGGIFRVTPGDPVLPSVYAPSEAVFTGWTSSAEVASLRVPAGTYLISAKVTATGVGASCSLHLDTHGLSDRTHVESGAQATTALVLQATVETAGGTLQFHCASIQAGASVLLENAHLHAIAQ